MTHVPRVYIPIRTNFANYHAISAAHRTVYRGLRRRAIQRLPSQFIVAYPRPRLSSVHPPGLYAQYVSSQRQLSIVSAEIADFLLRSSYFFLPSLAEKKNGAKQNCEKSPRDTSNGEVRRRGLLGVDPTQVNHHWPQSASPSFTTALVHLTRVRHSQRSIRHLSELFGGNRYPASETDSTILRQRSLPSSCERFPSAQPPLRPPPPNDQSYRKCISFRIYLSYRDTRFNRRGMAGDGT